MKLKTNDAGSPAMNMPQDMSNDINPLTSFIVTLEEHPNGEDLILPIPEPVMLQMGWGENTQLEFHLVDDGLIIQHVPQPDTQL